MHVRVQVYVGLLINNQDNKPKLEIYQDLQYIEKSI